MADFSTEAELSIVVPRRELRSARQEVEDALADIPVGMSASNGGGGGGGTNEAREQRRRRREFRWARQRTDDIEAQLEVLENIEGDLPEGGGGDLISSVTDLGGDAAGIATDLGTTLVQAAAPALGSLLGTAIGQQFGGGGSGGGADGSATIQKPEWIPIEVRDPSPLTVEEVPTVTVEDPSPLGVEDPSPLAVDDPSPLGVDDPSPLTVDDPSPLMVDAPMLQVEKPDWVPIQVDRPEPRGDTGRRDRRGVRQPDAFNGRRGILERGGGALDTIGGRIVNAIPGVNEPERNRSLSEGGKPIDRPFESIGRVLDAPGREIANLIERQIGARGSGGGGSTASIPATTGDVNVTVNADVESAVQRAIDDLRRAQERQREELRQDLENEISDLRRQIQAGSQGRGFR